MNKYTQTKPARRLGSDITQSTLQTTLDQAGIDKQIANLSYAEKRLVIITSLLNQVKEATGDWGKTIESPANQTRIMSEQWERLTRTIGNIFLPIVNKILPYVNAILMVLVEIGKVITEIVAKIFGFDSKDLDFGAGVGDSVDMLGDSMENTANKADKLKKSMLGLRSFDKILNISTPKNDTGSNGGLGIGSDIMGMANKAMDEYNSKLKNVKMRATEIRDSIMEWLGFTKHVNEETREEFFKFDHLTKGTFITGIVAGGAIFKGINTIYKILKKVGLLKFTGVSKLLSNAKILPQLISKLNPTVAVITAIGGALIYTYTHSEKFREKVNKMVTNVIELFKKLYDKTITIFNTLVRVLKPIIESLIDLAKPILDSFVAMWETTVGTIVDVISGLAEIISHIIDGDIKGAFDSFKRMLSNILDNVVELLGKLVKNIGDFAGKVLKKLYDLATQAPLVIADLFAKLLNAIIKTNWIELGIKIIKGIVDGIFSFGILLWNFGSRLIGALWSGIKDSELFKIGSKIVDGIIKGLFDWGGKITNWGAKFTDAIWKAVKKPFSLGSDISSLIPSSFKATGGVYSGGSWHDIQRYDGGGMPNSGQLFWARENGMPEMVGTLGGHTAVMNNDQIVGSVANGVYRAVLSANSQTQSNGNQVINIYLDKNKKLATYTLNELQSMAKSNGKPIEIGG